jgi:CubicO group peptidase (beta-lactamase class C family)
MKLNQLLGATLLVMCIAFSAFAQSPPIVTQPDELGLSSRRLQHLTEVFQSDIDGGKIPGAVVLIARAGKIAYFEALGFQDREKRIPMKADAIFRISAMTKPITSVAVMMLVEEGKIQIDDPLWFYLPEFKNLKVGVEKTSGETGKPQLVLEPALKTPTIQDLLRHTDGFALDSFSASLVAKAYQAANIRDQNQTLAEFASKLAGLPLAYQPGTTWEYSNVSTDVLGRIVEIVSGVSFDQFLSDRIFKPLGMTSTGFYVPASQLGRVAEPQVDSTTGKRPVMRDVSKRPNFMSGSGGLISTATDYFRFSQMLLNGGELDGVRLLSRRTVALMTADHLRPGTPIGAGSQFGSLVPNLDNGQGFGLGFAVRVAQGHNPYPGSPGEFYWVGAAGPAFWVDPKEKLIAIMMVQVAPSQTRHYRSVIRNLVYQSLTD